MAQKCDPRSDRLHPSKNGQMAQESQKHFRKLISTSSNRNNHWRENSVDSDQSDDGYDNDRQPYNLGSHFTLSF